jgi:hypothetical protein
LETPTPGPASVKCATLGRICQNVKKYIQFKLSMAIFLLNLNSLHQEIFINVEDQPYKAIGTSS